MIFDFFFWISRLIADKIRRRENQRIEMAENDQARRVAVFDNYLILKK